MRLSRFLRFFAIPILFIFGCSKENVQKPATSEPVLVQQYRQGAALVLVSLSETNIPTSGSLQFTLEIHAPPPNKIIFPELEGLVEPFAISGGYTEPPQTLPNGKQRHRRVWTLVPALPGETVFQAMEIHAGAASITTEPIAVSVSSLLPQGLDVFEIKDITAPIQLLPEQAKKQRFWKVLLSGIIAAIGSALLIRHLRKPKTIVVVPPHEAAFQALENLPGNPLEKTQALSEILVAYLDKRFQLPTTGKTILEIIPLLPKPILLGRRHKLEAYLEASEQIRFSNKVPPGFADEFKSYVHRFVEETTPETPCD